MFRRAGFRMRVFALIVLVALVATGATAWLTVQTTTAQLSESAAVEKDTADAIYKELTAYGTDHGTWEGVDRTVRSIGQRTGQRIRLTTLDGVVIADTDTLQGRTARSPSSRPATVLDPRPQAPADPLRFLDAGRLPGLLGTYRTGIRLAACLTRAGVRVHRETRVDGSWSFSPAASAEPVIVKQCAIEARGDGAEDRADKLGTDRCLFESRRQLADRLTGPLGGAPAGDTRPLPKATVKPAPEAAATPAPDAEPAPEAAVKPAPEAEGTPAAVDPANPLDPTVVPVPTTPSERDPVTGTKDRYVESLQRCLEELFADRLEAVAPVPLQLKLGFAQERPQPPSISGYRVLTAAGAVAVLVIICTVLLSRRVLAPIAALSRASRRLGAGDLSERVRVQGDDEISELALSFNRMADSLQRSEERQRRMINDIAHELRTPLSNIRGYLEALHDGVLAPDPDLFASLHEEAVLQQRLIDDLQELALAESGALPLHRSPLDVAELLETCGAAHRAVAASSGVGLRVETESPPAVDGDPDRLRQVIGNLVGNALRATPAGGQVVLGATRSGPDVLITVRDTGKGIAAEDIPHVFDRFWRADSARGRETGGRGLGLAIAREIVLAHGGTLTAESTVGVGSTFAIRLPAAVR